MSSYCITMGSLKYGFREELSWKASPRTGYNDLWTEYDLHLEDHMYTTHMAMPMI